MNGSYAWPGALWLTWFNINPSIRKHQSSASLAFVRGIHRWPVNSPHKGPVTRKMFLFDDVIMRHDITGHLRCYRNVLYPPDGSRNRRCKYKTYLYFHNKTKARSLLRLVVDTESGVLNQCGFSIVCSWPCRFVNRVCNQWWYRRCFCNEPRGQIDVPVNEVAGPGKECFVPVGNNRNSPLQWRADSSWWRHQMEIFSALLALCVGNSPVTGEFPLQRPVTRSLMFSLICAWINGSVNNR